MGSYADAKQCYASAATTVSTFVAGALTSNHNTPYRIRLIGAVDITGGQCT